LSTVFDQFIERRREIKEMLDQFSAVVFELMTSLCEHYPLIDPLNGLPIMQAEQNKTPDGSLIMALKTSNNRSLTFYFQSNGEVRVASLVGSESLTDDYVDLTLTPEGKVVVTTERGDYPIDTFIYTWTHSAFED